MVSGIVLKLINWGVVMLVVCIIAGGIIDSPAVKKLREKWKKSRDSSKKT